MNNLTENNASRCSAEHRFRNVSSRNLIIGGLDKNLSEEDVRNTCESYGQLESLTIILDRNNNRIAFVHYKEDCAAKLALCDMSTCKRLGTNTHVVFAKERLYDPTNVYVQGICKTTEEKELYELFCKHAPVLSVRKLGDERALVRMRHEEGAMALLKEFPDDKSNGNKIRCRLSYYSKGNYEWKTGKFVRKAMPTHDGVRDKTMRIHSPEPSQDTSILETPSNDQGSDKANFFPAPITSILQPQINSLPITPMSFGSSGGSSQFHEVVTQVAAPTTLPPSFFNPILLPQSQTHHVGAPHNWPTSSLCVPTFSFDPTEAASWYHVNAVAQAQQLPTMPPMPGCFFIDPASAIQGMYSNTTPTFPLSTLVWNMS